MLSLYPVDAQRQRFEHDLLVIGWIKNEIERKYNHLKVPFALKQLCYRFWLIKVSDKWDIEQYDKQRISVHDDGSITAKKIYACSIYGKHQVDIGRKYIWTLKMNKWCCGWSSIVAQPYIGIIKSDIKLLKKCETMVPKGNSAYGWGASKAKIDGQKAYESISYGEKCIKPNDIIEMSLDLQNMTLSYKINGNDYGVAFKDIDPCSYRLFVSFYHGKGTQLQLV